MIMIIMIIMIMILNRRHHHHHSYYKSTYHPKQLRVFATTSVIVSQFSYRTHWPMKIRVRMCVGVLPCTRSCACFRSGSRKILGFFVFLRRAARICRNLWWRAISEFPSHSPRRRRSRGRGRSRRSRSRRSRSTVVVKVVVTIIIVELAACLSMGLKAKLTEGEARVAGGRGSLHVSVRV